MRRFIWGFIFTILLISKLATDTFARIGISSTDRKSYCYSNEKPLNLPLPPKVAVPPFGDDDDDDEPSGKKQPSTLKKNPRVRV